MSITSRRTFLKGTALTVAAGTFVTAQTVASSAASAAYTLYADLSYAAPVGRAHLLDLYVPAGGNGPFPVVIYQAGSAFLSDDTKSGVPGALSGGTSAAGLAEMWAPHGYAIVGLNVRSSSQATFPAQVHDIKAAIRFLRASAFTYNLDAYRFAAMGTSSGGWVSTMAATTSGIDSLEGDLGNPLWPSSVQAVIDLFGPTDFLQMDAHRLIPGGMEHNPATSPESQLMGFALQTHRAAVEAANPATYVHRHSPPIFISHGTIDPLVPCHQSQLLFRAYAKAGASASLTLVPGAAHTDSYLASASLSPGRTVRTTRNHKVRTSAEPAPTYETLLTFLNKSLATVRPEGR